MQGELAVKRDRGLACKTDHRKAVRAVGGDLKLHGRVVQHQRLTDVHPQLVAKLLAENQNAVFLFAGALVCGQPQFTHRAQHSVRGNAAQLAGFDHHAAGQFCHRQCRRHDSARKYILCAGHNLHDFPAANVHLADLQVVAVRVLFNGVDARHHHVFNLTAANLKPLHFGAGHGHFIAVIFDCNIADVHKVSQPFHRKIHLSSPFQNCSRNRRSFS